MTEPARARPPVSSESDLLARLRARYSWPEWVFLDHVRSDAGFDATRTVDALAMNVWPSRGLELHGFECKVSRSDLLRELADPAKCETVCRFLDRWWIVAPPKVVLDVAELPPTWGLMETRGSGLAIVRDAQVLKPEYWTRGFLASLLRRDRKTTPPPAPPADLAAKLDAAVAEAREDQRRANLRDLAELESLRRTVREFETSAGVKIDRWDAGHVGEAVALVLGSRRTRTRVHNIRDDLRRTASALAAEFDELDRLVAEADGAAERLTSLDTPTAATAHAPPATTASPSPEAGDEA